MFGSKITVKSIIPGPSDPTVSNNQLGGHHQVTNESGKEIVGTMLQSRGGKKQKLRPVKGKSGGGPKNPPSRCIICNCLLGIEPHSIFKRCGRIG